MGFSRRDIAGGRPAWIKRIITQYKRKKRVADSVIAKAEESDILGADSVETAASNIIAHQGWTVPAGGNGNSDAMRETLICMNMEVDEVTDDDVELGIGAGGTPYAEWDNGWTSPGYPNGGSFKSLWDANGYDLNNWTGTGPSVGPWLMSGDNAVNDGGQGYHRRFNGITYVGNSYGQARWRDTWVGYSSGNPGGFTPDDGSSQARAHSKGTHPSRPTMYNCFDGAEYWDLASQPYFYPGSQYNGYGSSGMLYIVTHWVVPGWSDYASTYGTEPVHIAMRLSGFGNSTLNMATRRLDNGGADYSGDSHQRYAHLVSAYSWSGSTSEISGGSFQNSFRGQYTGWKFFVPLKAKDGQYPWGG